MMVKTGLVGLIEPEIQIGVQQFLLFVGRMLLEFLLLCVVGSRLRFHNPEAGIPPSK